MTRALQSTPFQNPGGGWSERYGGRKEHGNPYVLYWRRRLKCRGTEHSCLIKLTLIYHPQFPTAQFPDCVARFDLSSSKTRSSMQRLEGKLAFCFWPDLGKFGKLDKLRWWLGKFTIFETKRLPEAIRHCSF